MNHACHGHPSPSPMGRLSSQKRHLKQIAANRASTKRLRASVDLAEMPLASNESVSFVSVQEGVKLVDLAPEAQAELDEWNSLLLEPKSDGPDCDTDDEDWSTTGMADQDAAAVREWQAQHQNKKQQSQLMVQMQDAATSMPSTRKHHVGNSRANVHHKKQVLKKAAQGTSPLSSFGFVPIGATSATAPSKDGQAKPMEVVCKGAELNISRVKLHMKVINTGWCCTCS